ncbi:ABC transporter permease [Mesorhizobium sp. 1B3]|uniref:ABC transporter permease n=1 Tax=Mesorhizobium sp. 1B3 TaxID=3243599 RepID=UPI003D96E0AE
MQKALSHAGFLVGGGGLLLIFLVALLAPWLSPHDPYYQDLSMRLADPVWSAEGSWHHVLGTDALGRDLLSRLLHGLRVSLAISVGATLISIVIGSTLGIAGGYFGGWIDNFITYVVNVKLALPSLLVSMSLIAVFGASIGSLTVILGILVWDRYAIVLRSVTQQLRSQEFVHSARAVGASDLRILLKEILPNVANHIIVIASLEIGIIILIESVLSFIGLGVQPPTPSLGLLIAEGRNVIFFKPLLVVVPGVAILTTVLAVNLAGDGLRDILTPEGRNV